MSFLNFFISLPSLLFFSFHHFIFCLSVLLISFAPLCLCVISLVSLLSLHLFSPLVWTLADGCLSHVWDSSHSSAPGWLKRLKLKTVCCSNCSACALHHWAQGCFIGLSCFCSSSGASNLMGCLLSNKVCACVSVTNPWVSWPFAL